MSRLSPLGKVGTMLAIRQLARDRAGIIEPLGALEWALKTGILAPRPGVELGEGREDLVVTEKGQRIVHGFWAQRESRRLERIARNLR